MGEAIFCRKGVSAKNMADGYAIISVRYPAMSDCRCEKGGCAYTVKKGAGASAFAVSESGTWTVTISDGTHTNSGSVNISAAGEIKNMQIGYSFSPVSGETALLSSGSGLASGYSLSGNARMSGNAIRETGDGGFWLSPAVDLSGYSRVTVSGVLQSAASTQSILRVGSTTDKVYNLVQTPERAVSWSGFIGLEGSVTLDVSALNGTYYIGSAFVGNNLEITGIVLS